jgi:DNA-binding XRE family transcriptional regulator
MSNVAEKPQAKKLNTGRHAQRLEKRLAEDPEFRAEYERQRRAIVAIDEIVNSLESLRIKHDYSKADLARMIDKNPASVRRLLTAATNPELGTIVAMADALDADIMVVPRTKRAAKSRQKTSA